MIWQILLATVAAAAFLVSQQGDDEEPSPASADAWIPGPGGYGRGYGAAAPPTEAWESNKPVIAADCSWVAEGEYFLRPEDANLPSAGRMAPSLAEALEAEADSLWPGAGANTAWGYVRHLQAQDVIDPDTIADALVAEALGLWADNGAGVPDASRCGSSPQLDAWRASLAARIGASPALGARGSIILEAEPVEEIVETRLDPNRF